MYFLNYCTILLISKLQLKPEEKLKLKNCKLKEVVHKYILARRLQKMREEQLTSLSRAMKALKRQYEDKKQEAMEKLVSLFETPGILSS